MVDSSMCSIAVPRQFPIMQETAGFHSPDRERVKIHSATVAAPAKFELQEKRRVKSDQECASPQSEPTSSSSLLPD